MMRAMTEKGSVETSSGEYYWLPMVGWSPEPPVRSLWEDLERVLDQ